MKKTNLAISLLVAVIFVIVGLRYFDGKKAEINEVKGSHTVIIGDGPIEFDLPQGYMVYTSGGYEGGYEGGYAFTVNIGKKVRENYFNESAPTIYIRDFVIWSGDPKEYKEYKPSEYVDVVFTNGPDSGNLEPKIVTLFGNKAVRTITDADGHPVIVGYLRGDQLPASFQGKEYSVIVSGATYGSGKEFSQELFDMVVNSLRIKSN